MNAPCSQRESIGLIPGRELIIHMLHSMGKNYSPIAREQMNRESSALTGQDARESSEWENDTVRAVFKQKSSLAAACKGLRSEASVL